MPKKFSEITKICNRNRVKTLENFPDKLLIGCLEEINAAPSNHGQGHEVYSLKNLDSLERILTAEFQNKNAVNWQSYHEGNHTAPIDRLIKSIGEKYAILKEMNRRAYNEACKKTGKTPIEFASEYEQ